MKQPFEDKTASAVVRLISDHAETTSAAPHPSSRQESPQTRTARRAASMMFDFLPQLDVGDPKAFVAAVVTMLAQYPAEVMFAAVDPARGIPSRADRPTLRLIKEVCEEYYAPIEHALWRDRVQQEAVPLPPRRQRTPAEQAVADEKVAAMRRQLGIPAEGLPRRGAQARVLEDRPLSKNLLADLEARKARNQVPPEPSSDGNS